MVISAVCLPCAESTLSDKAYPYWPKKERKLKKRHPMLMAELRDLHADVMCLQVRLFSPLRGAFGLTPWKALKSMISCLG